MLYDLKSLRFKVTDALYDFKSLIFYHIFHFQIVSNHTGRNFMLIYLGTMHLLVFFTIYWATHNVHHGCDPLLDNLPHPPP